MIFISYVEIYFSKFHWFVLLVFLSARCCLGSSRPFSQRSASFLISSIFFLISRGVVVWCSRVCLYWFDAVFMSIEYHHPVIYFLTILPLMFWGDVEVVSLNFWNLKSILEIIVLLSWQNWIRRFPQSLRVHNPWLQLYHFLILFALVCHLFHFFM